MKATSLLLALSSVVTIATTQTETKAEPVVEIQAIKLAIGKEAPEIIGKDVDGNEMKLSDYKGKVAH